MIARMVLWSVYQAMKLTLPGFVSSCCTYQPRIFFVLQGSTAPSISNERLAASVGDSNADTDTCQKPMVAICGT